MLANLENIYLHQDKCACVYSNFSFMELDVLGFNRSAHPPYSPDLAPMDFSGFFSGHRGIWFENLVELRSRVMSIVSKFKYDWYRNVFAKWEAVWRRIQRLTHNRLHIDVCVEMQRTNDFTSFMRWKSTHKGEIAYMRHNCAFFYCTERLSYWSWRKRNYIVLLGSLLLCHVFPQRIKDLNLELLVYYRS